MNNDVFITEFQHNYNRVLNFTGGNDLNIMMSLASTYTLKKKQFSGVLLEKVIEQFEEQGKGSFPISKQLMEHYRLGMLLISHDNLTAQEILENDQLLNLVEFKKSAYRGYSAFFLKEDKEAHAKRAKKLYDAMNQNQWFLTSKEDIPYTLILTRPSSSIPEKQAETIYHYYKALKNHQFTIGNHLQALAQILTLYSSQYHDELTRYVVQLKTSLTERNVRVKRVHYPLLGLLALTATNETKIEEIISLYHQLIEQKIFKQAKEYALILAIQKVVQDLIELKQIIDLPYPNYLIHLCELADFMVDISTLIPSNIGDILDWFN